MAKQRVMIVGGGLAGLAAAMKLAELGVDVDLMSLTPVQRSHSVCAQGGINSVNNLTRQQGDTEWLHFDDTVYGGDFLQHQPPVKEMAEWGPKIIDLMDRLGRPLQSHARGLSRSAPLRRHAVQAHGLRRRHDRPAIALRLDEQVRRWEVEGKIKKYEFWDFLGPDPRRQRRLPRLRRPGPGDDGDSHVSRPMPWSSPPAVAG